MDYPSQHTLAGLVTTLSLGALSVSRLFLVNNVQEDAMWLYQIGFSAFHISISIRTASLALLSVVVYIIIKHGLSRVKLAPLIASVVILWVVVVLSGLPYLTPAYQYEPFRNGILVCDTTFTTHRHKRHTYTWSPVYGTTFTDRAKHLSLIHI